MKLKERQAQAELALTRTPTPAMICAAVVVILWVAAFKDVADTVPADVRRQYAEAELPLMTYRGMSLLGISLPFMLATFFIGVGWWVRKSEPRYRRRIEEERKQLLAWHEADVTASIRDRMSLLADLEAEATRQAVIAKMTPEEVQAMHATIGLSLREHDERVWWSKKSELLQGAVLGFVVAIAGQWLIDLF